MNEVSSRPSLIVDLWRRMPGELGYLLLGLPIAMAGMTVFITLVALGVSLVVFTVGLFVLVGALLAARAFGRLERERLRRAGRPAIASPVWPVPDPARGFISRTLTPLRDGASWRYLLHAGLVQPVLAIVSWSVALTWAVLGLSGTTYWFWIRFIPMTGENILLHRVILDASFPGNTWVIDPVVGENVLYFVVGVVALVTLPLVTRSLDPCALGRRGRAAQPRAHRAAARGGRGARRVARGCGAGRGPVAAQARARHPRRPAAAARPAADGPCRGRAPTRA